MPKTTAEANTVLTDRLDSTFFGLSTTYPTLAGGSFTEPSPANGYARQAITYGTAASGSRSNSSALSFPASTGNQGRFVAGGIWSASTSGVLRYFEWLGKETSKYFQPADVNTTTNRITLTGHGWSDGDSAVIRTPAGSTIIAGASVDTEYFVKAIDANTIELYTNSGLTTILDITSAGAGSQEIFRFLPRNVNASGITLSFASGQIVNTEQ
jgi:hypothetical protein